MRAYVGLFRMRLLAGLQYRAAAWAGIATQFFWGFMRIMIFEAFYRSTSAALPMDFSQLSAYIWLQQAFLALFMLWYRDMDLFSMITSGNVAYELCRPTRLYTLWFSRLLAGRIASASLRFAPILAVAALLPMPYRLMPPAGVPAFLLFLIALALSLLLTTTISMLIYILTFVTLSPFGSMTIISVFAEFFSGMLIPIPYLPQWLQRIADILPFRYTADLPFRLYSGSIGMQEGFVSLGVAFAWTILLLAVGEWAMRRVLRRAVIQGG